MYSYFGVVCFNSDWCRGASSCRLFADKWWLRLHNKQMLIAHAVHGLRRQNACACSRAKFGSYVGNDMNEYLVKVERDSVCMGDDIDAPHSYSFKLPREATLNDVFKHLAGKRYLASVAGRNHSWEAMIDNKSLARFIANNPEPEPSVSLSTKISVYVNEGALLVCFKYNSAAT
jgi:hypothetical protein